MLSGVTTILMHMVPQCCTVSMPQRSGKGERDAGQHACMRTLAECGPAPSHASVKSKGRMRYLRLLRREAHRRHLLMWHHTLLRWHAAHRPRGMLRGPQRGPAGAWGGSKPRPRLLHRHPSRPWRSHALHGQYSASTQGGLHSGASTCLLRNCGFACPTHAVSKPHLGR